MKRNFKKIFTIIASIFVTLSAGASVFFFTSLFKRSANNTIVSYDDYKNKYPRKEVTFSTNKNDLAGYIYGENNKNGIVVIAHGINDCGDSHLLETMYFVDHGWMVFNFDGTGAGKSTGKSIMGFPQMRVDLTYAIEFIHALYPDMEIVLYGHSSGGYAVSTVNHEDVSAVVSISGFNSPVESMISIGSVALGPAVYLEIPFLAIGNFMKFGSNVSAVSALNKTDIPVLIVQGSGDKIVYKSVSIYGHKDEIKKPNVSFWLIQDATRNDHSNIWLIDNKYLNTEFMDEINTFYLNAIE